MRTEIEFLKETIFKLLLITENRTTDFLETVVNDKIRPKVVEQKIIRPDNNERVYILRESLLLTETNALPISHNIAYIYPDAIPLELYSKLLQKKEGIGKAIKIFNLSCERKLIESGWKSKDNVSDLRGEIITLGFETTSAIPYKEYTINFSEYSGTGIHLIEYYNPLLTYLREHDKQLSVQGE